MVLKAESGEGRKRDWEGVGWGEVWRSPLGGGQAAPPRRSPTSRRAACPGEDLLRWNSEDEAEARSGSIQHFPSFPFWFGLRHFGYGSAATSASRPSLLLLFALQLPKTDSEDGGLVEAPWKG